MTTDESTEHGQPSSVLGRRLAACECSDLSEVPTWAELGLLEAKDAAFAWQRQRRWHDWHQIVWTQEDPIRSRWVGEIHGLFGLAGEAVLVSIEAEAEKVLLRRVIDRGDESGPLTAIRWRAMRFFAEGQANHLVTAGHLVANLTLRTLALHPGGLEAIGRALPRWHAEPRASTRNGWISLNSSQARSIARAARHLASPALVALAEHLNRVTAHESSWAALNDLRGEQYHRWRGESPGVSGFNFNDVPVIDRLLAGQAVGVGAIPDDYVEGMGVVDALAGATTRVLADSGPWMTTYLDLWDTAFNSLRRSPA